MSGWCDHVRSKRVGGVCGAMFNAARGKIAEESVKVCPCETGHVKATSGYDLPAMYIIHAVGSMHSNDSNRDQKVSYCAYASALRCTSKKN